MKIEFVDLGLVPYQAGWDFQKRTHALRCAGGSADTVIFCEHPAVFTLGRKDCEADILITREMAAMCGIEVIKTDRGGRVTYHGPGQLVAYFIFDIGRWGVKNFVGMVAGSISSALSRWNVKTVWEDGHPGLWTDGKKIAAVGFHISEGVSLHGAAVNISPDMEHFRYIIPCGIKERGVTSLKQILGEACPSLDAVREAMISSIRETFG